MKQLKEPRNESHGRHDADAPMLHGGTPDSRPVKPAAEYRGRRLAPSSGPASGLPAKPKASARAGVHPGEVTTDGGRRAKAPVTAAPDGREPAGTVDGDRPDQRPVDVPAAEGGPVEQYVRLRVRLRGDELTLLDSHLVDGPLAQPDALHATTAYEVLSGDRLLHAAAVPDLGLERRSFPDPDDAPQQRGHHVAPRASTVFTVRVPAAELTAETLAGVRVRLHRVAQPVHGLRAAARSLAEHADGLVTPVAELSGLPESVLPQAIEARGGRTGQGTRA